MKIIYTFTLNGNEYDLKKFNNNLRLLAYMVYDSIYNYYGEGYNPLDINDEIEYNNINEDIRDNVYRLDSEIYNDGYNDYEPFIIGNRSFGLTIALDEFGMDKIQEVLTESLVLLGLDYKVSIDSVSYEAKDIDDESNRDVAMKTVFNRLGCKFKRNSLFGMIIRNSKPNRRSSQRR